MQPSDPPTASSPSQFGIASRRKSPSSARQGCGADADAGGAQAAALAALLALSNSCTNASALVNQNQLGPYGDSGSCSYDCGFKDQSWWWKADYRPTNSNLVQVVAANNISGPYTTAFQPTQTWVNTDLPASGNSLTATLAAIAQIDAAIVAAGGNETPAQSSQLAAAFNNLPGILQVNLNQANYALQKLASYLSWVQGGGVGPIQGYVTAAQSYIKTDATKAEENLIGEIACGSGDVTNSFNGMFADVNAKFANMQPGFDAVTAKLAAALQAGDHVAGVFLTLQSDSTLVSEQITQAQSYPPTSGLRTMHLNIAGNEWSDFVQEANFQLQPGSGVHSVSMNDETDSASPRSPAPASSLSFRMPRQMALPGICRGALTYWPQMLAALAELRQDPAFRLAFPPANLIGSPAQLRAALATDSAWLLRSTPPADLYAWFVWLTLRVHQAARTFHLTLLHLPDLFKSMPPASPASSGALVGEALIGSTGVIQLAGNLKGLSNIFAQHLHKLGGDLTSAQADYDAAAAALPEQIPGQRKRGAEISDSMLAYSRACATTHHAQQHHSQFKTSAAKVTALAVIANMTSATQSASVAWQSTMTQFEAIAACEAARLGDEDFLRNELQLETAANEWGAFAGVIQKFIQRVLLD